MFLRLLSFLAIFSFLAIPSLSAQQLTLDERSEMRKLTAALSEAARNAALSSGVAEPGAIACDGFVCTCDGAFDCAWLSYFCSAVGGVKGFDDECYTPSRDQATNRAVLDLKLMLEPIGPVEASCEGIFCSCSGGENSDDCQTLSATCIDEVSCIGDSCGCIGGTARE